ncbi:MAG: hypothetical protein HOP11_08470 [Saprospiraceae bacterium]|nr:hypothetical protein [Saprospiraceae bacterium]
MIKNIQISIYILCISCALGFPEPLININNQGAEVHFTRKMKQEDLNSIKSSLQNYGVEINYLDSKFDGGNLSKLSFEIKTLNGQVGEASTNFVNLRGKPFGFKLKYDGSEFIVGEIKSKL